VELAAEDQGGVRGRRDAYDSYQHATVASRHRELVTDRFVDLIALAGTPDEVVTQVRRVMEVPAVRRIIILPQVPGTAFSEREATLKLVSDAVISRIGSLAAIAGLVARAGGPTTSLVGLATCRQLVLLSCDLNERLDRHHPVRGAGMGHDLVDFVFPVDHSDQNDVARNHRHVHLAGLEITVPDEPGIDLLLD